MLYDVFNKLFAKTLSQYGNNAPSEINKLFAKTLLQYGNNTPSEMVSFYCVTHNKNS